MILIAVSIDVLPANQNGAYCAAHSLKVDVHITLIKILLPGYKDSSLGRHKAAFSPRSRFRVTTGSLLRHKMDYSYVK